MAFNGKFTAGQWVYVTGDLSESIPLNPTIERDKLLSKQGKRLLIQYPTSVRRPSRDEVYCYRVSGVNIAEDDLCSCEDYKAFKAAIAAMKELL